MIGQRLDIAEMAETILSGVVAHYAAATDPEVQALPGRQLILAGDAATLAWDCEQLTVTCQGVSFGPADDAVPPVRQVGAGASVSSVRRVPFEVSLVRCVEVGEDEGGPPALTLHAEGMRFMRDLGMLSQALVHIASRMRTSLGPGGLVRAGEVLPAGPEGGYVAAVGLFTISIMGTT